MICPKCGAKMSPLWPKPLPPEKRFRRFCRAFLVIITFGMCFQIPKLLGICPKPIGRCPKCLYETDTWDPDY